MTTQLSVWLDVGWPRENLYATKVTFVVWSHSTWLANADHTALCTFAMAAKTGPTQYIIPVECENPFSIVIIRCEWTSQDPLTTTVTKFIADSVVQTLTGPAHVFVLSADANYTPTACIGGVHRMLLVPEVQTLVMGGPGGYSLLGAGLLTIQAALSDHRRATGTGQGAFGVQLETTLSPNVFSSSSSSLAPLSIGVCRVLHVTVLLTVALIFLCTEVLNQ